MTLSTFLKPLAGKAVGAGALIALGTLAAYAQDAAAPAAEAAAPATTMDKGDTAWMMVSTILVLFMILPGLALFYGWPDAHQEHALGAHAVHDDHGGRHRRLGSLGLLPSPSAARPAPSGAGWARSSCPA